MKIAVLVLAALAVAAASVVHTKAPRKVADGEFLTKQKQILQLLIGVGHEDTFTSEWKDFDIQANTDHWADSKYVSDFFYSYKHGFLPKDGVFTLNCKKTLKQTIKLFNLFYFAKDYDTFYKTACWAREHLHGVQFAYTFYVAVYHRPDCHGISLPSLYEVFPHYFVTSELVQKFYDAKMQGFDEYKVYLNDSGWENYYHSKAYDGVIQKPWDTHYNHVEEKLSYFREDVGLNDFLAQFFVFYPTWLDQDYYKDIYYFRRGETLYYFFQQIFARYALERFANEMPHTELLYWDQPIHVGYNPKLQHYNGQYYFPRPDNMIPYEYNPHYVYHAQTYERRILDTIDVHSFFSEKNYTWVPMDEYEGIDHLGNAVWSTPDSIAPHYYGNYFWKALNAIGYMVKTGSDREFVHGAMGSIITSARDPAFYQFLHRLIKLFHHYKSYYPYYTNKDLEFPGVKIDKFEVDKLVTFFDRYDFEVTNLVPVTKDEKKTYKDYHYVAKQFRLNHKPFTYKLTVNSDKATDAMVRVFIGPKYDAEGRELTIEQARMAFVEFDRFPAKLTNGQNIFERNSKESPAFVEEHESLRSFYTRVLESHEKKEPFYVSDSFKCGMPERFMLPKGWKEGQPFVFYAIVTPWDEKYTPKPEERYFDSYILCGSSKYYDHKPYGFPFDRRVPYEEEFHYPNMYFKDIHVYHKEEADINRV